MRRTEALKIPEDQADEPSMEIPVGKTESDVATLKVDVREFRADMKAANESIADLKTAVATVDGKIDALSAEMNGRFGALSAEMNGKIDALRAEMNGKFDALRAEMNGKFAEVNGKLDALSAKVEANTKDIAKLDARVSKLDERLMGACDDIADLKAMVKAVLWVLGIGMVGAIGKVFNWI
jgi:chromosome segregation ATPase